MSATKDKTAATKTPRRISAGILYASITLTAVVFGTFFVLCADSMYGAMFSPATYVLTDVVIITIYLFIAATMALTAWSMARSAKVSSRIIDKDNLINSARIKKCIFAFVTLCLTTTFALASNAPVSINGAVFDDRLLLKITDMFINTTLTLVVIALCGLFYGMSGHIRKRK